MTLSRRCACICWTFDERNSKKPLSTTLQRSTIYFTCKTQIAIEKESLDRTDLNLPRVQRDLIRYLYRSQSAPIVVVLVRKL